MPKIPLYTAESRAGILDLPRAVPYDTGEVGEAFGKELATTGEYARELIVATDNMNRARIEKIQKQQDDNLIAQRIAEFNADLKIKRREIEADVANPLGWKDAFNTAANDLYTKMAEGLPNAYVADAFRKHAFSHYPDVYAEVLNNSLKVAVNDRIAEHVTLGDTLLNDLQDASPEERQQGIALYDKTISSGTKMGKDGLPPLYKPQVAEKLINDFVNKLNVKHMETAALSRPEETRNAILSGQFNHVPALKREETIVNINDRLRKDQVHKREEENLRKQASVQYWTTIAGVGGITRQQRSDLIAGRVPGIDPSAGVSLVRLNDNPPDGTGDDAFEALKQQYLLDKNLLKVGTAERYQTRVAEMLMASGTRSKSAMKFLEELKHDRTTERVTLSAETNAGIQRTKDFIEQEVKAPSRFSFSANERQKIFNKYEYKLRTGQMSEQQVKEQIERELAFKAEINRRRQLGIPLGGDPNKTPPVPPRTNLQPQRPMAPTTPQRNQRSIIEGYTK